MFGKSEWFGTADSKKVLRPSAKKGWVYYLGWFGVIIVPTLLIVVVANFYSALIWASVSGIVFFLDYRKVLHMKRETEAYDKLFFIGENVETAAETENYEIVLKE